MSKSLSLKNHQLVPLVQFLESQALQGKESRLRTRFIKLFISRIQENETERVALLKKHAEKREEDGVSLTIYLDREGNETTDENKGVNVKIGNVEEFNKEYLTLMNEDFVLDVTPASEEMVMGVKDIILNSKTALSGMEAMNYDFWCEAFEAIDASE